MISLGKGFTWGTGGRRKPWIPTMPLKMSLIMDFIDFSMQDCF